MSSMMPSSNRDKVYIVREKPEDWTALPGFTSNMCRKESRRIRRGRRSSYSRWYAVGPYNYKKEWLIELVEVVEG